MKPTCFHWNPTRSPWKSPYLSWLARAGSALALARFALPTLASSRIWWSLRSWYLKFQASLAAWWLISSPHCLVSIGIPRDRMNKNHFWSLTFETLRLVVEKKTTLWKKYESVGMIRNSPNMETYIKLMFQSTKRSEFQISVKKSRVCMTVVESKGSENQWKSTWRFPESYGYPQSSSILDWNFPWTKPSKLFQIGWVPPWPWKPPHASSSNCLAEHLWSSTLSMVSISPSYTWSLVFAKSLQNLLAGRTVLAGDAFWIYQAYAQKRWWNVAIKNSPPFLCTIV